MEKIDQIIFGDNQFFGINHMSQEKAQQLAEKFYDLKNIIKVYEYALNSNINAIMLNSNDRAKEICKFFRENKSEYSNINWYPSLPYPHKYANLVAEKGIVSAINDVIFTDNSTNGLLGLISKGGSALLGKDVVKIMQMLIDIEIKSFRDLNIKAIFLQNIITDLLLGLKAKIFFVEYAEYIRNKYKVVPGFITMNLPSLIESLQEWGIYDVVICSSINKIGYLMSPNLTEYENVLSTYDKNKYQIMAMSVLASGAIPVNEAIEYVTNLNVDSIVFGASSQSHIVETKRQIETKYKTKSVTQPEL